MPDRANFAIFIFDIGKSDARIVNCGRITRIFILSFLTPMIKIILIPAIAVSMGNSVRAAALSIVNPGFESDAGVVSGGTSWSNNAQTGWSDPQGNDNTNFIENIGGFSSNGIVHVGFDANEFGMIYQDLSTAWAANTKYTLTVGVGNRNGTGAGTGRFGFGKSTDVLSPGVAGDNGPYVLQTPSLYFSDLDTATVATAGGSFADATFTFSTGAVAPSGNIRISAQWKAGPRLHVDNFRLDGSPIPEPTSLATLGLALGLLSRRRRA